MYISTGSPELKRAHAIQTLYTAKHLAAKHQVIVVYPLTISSLKTGALKAAYRKHGVELKLIPTTSMGTALKSSRLFIIDKKIFAHLAASFARKSGADVIITRDPIVAAYVEPDLFEIHKLEHLMTKGNAAKVYKEIEERAITKSRVVVAISQWLYEYCKKKRKGKTVLLGL